MDLSGVEVMDRFREVMDLPEFDLWNMIQHSLSLAHTDHYDQLRLRRDRFVELMYAPRPQQGSDVGLVRNFSSDKTSARSGMYNKDVEKEPGHVKDEYEDGQEDEDEREQGEYREEQEIVRIDDSEDDEPTAQDVARDVFDDDVEALQDEIEREDLFMKEIDSIRSTIESVPANYHLPEDEAMEILDRLHELNINVDFVKVLQESNIGKLINRMSRKHPDRDVKDKAHVLVSAWKALVDEFRARQLAEAASAHDESGPVSEEEVGLAAPPLDEGGLFASRDVKISEILNFSESDLSAATGASSASESPFGVNHSGRVSSSSPDNEQHIGREGKGVARVLKVDKHRPIHLGGKPSLDERNANPSGSIKKGHKPPSERGPSQLRANTATTSAPVSKHGLAARPRQMVQGSEMEYEGTTGNAGYRKSDAMPKPNVGAIRPRVETNKTGLATRVEPLPRDVNARVEPVPTDIDAAIMQSKRKLQEGYANIANGWRILLNLPPEIGFSDDVSVHFSVVSSSSYMVLPFLLIRVLGRLLVTAKKNRTVRPLELTELPKGGPKAQRPGQRGIKAK